MKRTSVNQIFASLLLLLLLWITGCGRDPSTSYGASSGILAKRSVNGFSTFRSALVDAGFADRDLTRLTEQARKSSLIVWTPTHPTGIEWRTTTWLEQWFRAGDKTLIYVIPDSGCESEFYQDARPLAAPEQRIEYRRKYAESLTTEHRWQLARTPLLSNGWFFVRPKVQTTPVEVADGLPAELDDWNAIGGSSRLHRTEWVLEAYQRGASTQQGTPIWTSVGPGGEVWTYGETTTPTTTAVEFQSILESESGDPLVARITSDSWKSSQIFVVAGGSLLTNYGLTHSSNQQLAEVLIEQSLTPLVTGNLIDPLTHLRDDGSKPIASFATGPHSLPISEHAGDIPRSSGAEFFSQFPLSFVTLHIAILAFVICLILLPIFGRPHQIDRGVLTHFGDHLSAVATLMRRQGGEVFARRRISEYMKRVRDEESGPWVIHDPPVEHPSAVHLHLAGTPAVPPLADAAGQPTELQSQDPAATPTLASLPNDQPSDNDPLQDDINPSIRG